MMYYFIGKGRVIEAFDTNDPRHAAQMIADECQCHIEVIRGQHTGIEAQPQEQYDDDAYMKARELDLPV